MKRCSKCKIESDDESLFITSRNNCKKCVYEYNKLYFERNREKEKSRRMKYYYDNRELETIKMKEDRKNNPEKYKERDKIYNLKRREYLLEYNKKYREKNKEYFKIKRIEWRDKKKQDTIYKFFNSVRNSILKSIKRGYIKNSKTIDILGCSYDNLVKHFESKFEPWMTWDNRGKYNGDFNFGWDIDHIIPVSIAKNEEDIIRLNHYTNLQPLCSKINRDIKKNKILN